ncbi:MAG: potassium-transporting ATPase subunit KdpA [Parachlamydiaceae bacterium]|nr:potassium-transporting ATPase subunit KdpA [Parachlamydiaceae bacterium]
MIHKDFLELISLCLVLIVLIPVLGHYLTLIFDTPPSYLLNSFGVIERGIYRLCKINPEEEMDWKSYLKALLFFNFIGFLFLFILLLAQQWLPFNPQHFPSVPWPTALNTAISFVTNTNWQSYAGENSLSYLSQAFGLTVQNFLSASTGMAVLLVLIRGIHRRSSLTIGNYWKDLTRSVVYLFLPLAIIFAIILVSQGVIENFNSYQTATTIENQTQIIPGGPVASQVAIKQLGTNGGGFFNANSAHPFENPTPFTNFLEIVAILAIPASLTYFYGCMIKQKKEGWILFGVMFGFWVIGVILAIVSEWIHNPLLEMNPVFEGKETRLGITNSVLWTITTTATSNGSVNMGLDSLSPLAGGIALFFMTLGEIIFGGIGTGLSGMIMYVILTVFLAGLMVGRSPEYLGKKIEKKEICWALVAIIIPSAITLIGTSITLLLPTIKQYLGNQGPHGLTEVLYGFASTGNGNGSAFSGLHSDTNYFNLVFSFMMLASRLAIIVPTIVIAGSLASKGITISSAGTFKTDSILFGVLLSCVILIIAGLTFFPAFALGPIVEHLLMLKAHAF